MNNKSQNVLKLLIKSYYLVFVDVTQQVYNELI